MSRNYKNCLAHFFTDLIDGVHENRGQEGDSEDAEDVPGKGDCNTAHRNVLKYQK